MSISLSNSNGLSFWIQQNHQQKHHSSTGRTFIKGVTQSRRLHVHNNLVYASNNFRPTLPQQPKASVSCVPLSLEPRPYGADSQPPLLRDCIIPCQNWGLLPKICPLPNRPVKLWIQVVLPACLTRKETKGVLQKGIHQLTTSEITQPNNTNNLIPSVWVSAILL